MKRFKSLMVILAMYIVAIAIGFISGYFLPISSLYWQIFVMDVVATIIIWVFSLITKNTSVYDPYWSFIPMLISFYAFFKIGNFTPINIIYLVVLNAWGARLTFNWCVMFHSFEYEDWRYRHYRETLSKPLFHLVNFFGLQMIPTIVVYAALSPMFVIFQNENNYLALIGIAIMVFGIFMELIADHQMHSFLNTTKEKVTCKKGLWNYSRHPNYLGENSIWVGTFVSMVIIAPQYWYVGVGMIMMIALFLFISIPLMEKRQLKRRSDYKEYRRTTSVLLLLPHRKRNEN